MTIIKCQRQIEMKDTQGDLKTLKIIMTNIPDPRRYRTDAEILYEKIDLKDSALTKKEKAKLMKMILKYRDAFSLKR